MKMSIVQPMRSQVQAVATSAAEFKVTPIFKVIEDGLKKEGEKAVKKINGIFCFKVTNGPGGKTATWIVDAKNGRGGVRQDDSGKGDVTITMSDDNLFNMMTGKLDGQQAFFSGKMKIAGNMGLAMKLKDLQGDELKSKL